MSKLFYSRFYHEIFVGLEQFATAATKARSQLRDDPRRWSYEHDRNINVQDWFVPVVYSNGNDEAFNKYPGIGHSARLRDSRHFYLFIIMLIMSASKGLYDFAFVERKHPYFYAYLAPFMLYFVNIFVRYWRKYWFHQGLKALSQDRKNILRIEGDLRYSRKIFVHTSDDFEKTAPHLLGVLTDIWRRTHLGKRALILFLA